ncbi:MAG: NFACT family protein [Clostridia bacterium]|nr:NFACT family protein [Clostridia bacterium]
MPQDAFTMKIAARELNALLSGGKINKITQPAKDELIFTVYTGGKTVAICISANAQSARICPTRAVYDSPAVAPNFCMLLRKHLSGATVKEVLQLGYERITEIVFDTKNDFREAVEKKLVCEIMGKYSNVFLTENGRILGALRPPVGDLNGSRLLLTGVAYSLPPAQDKFEITDKTRVSGAFLSFNGGDLPAFAAATVKGVSLPTARELTFRFFGSPSVTSFKGKEAEFYDFAAGFLENPPVKPNVCGGDFYVCEYEHIGGERKFFDTLLEAEEHLFDGKDAERKRRQSGKTLADKLKAHEKKLRKKLQALTEKELSCEDAEENRIKGELLTAYQHSVREGAEWCELANYYSETGETVKIKLDPSLSANRNAQNYFKKYAKQKKTLAAVAPQKEEVSAELDYLQDIYSELERCERPSDFEALAEELKEAGILKKENGTRRKKEQPSMPKIFVFGDFVIKAGRNNVQNDRLVSSSERDDIWLHTKNFHSAHVIVQTEGRKVPDGVLLFAAEICAYYSKARGGDKVHVDYCLKKYVKKPPKAKPGGVIYTDFKTILVTPAPHAEYEKGGRN